MYIDVCLTAGCQYRDIGFLLDASGSITEDQLGIDTYGLMKRFVQRIIGRLDLGPAQNRVGLVQFSETAETVFTFNTFANRSKADIYQTIENMAGFGDNTNTALGLRLL